MKANKIFAAALAVLTLVGFSACKKDNVEALTLDPTSMTLKVGEEATITATVAATWVTSNEAVATVVPGNDGGKTAKVTAVAEGNAIISATAGGTTKTCVVKVENGGGGGESAKIEATSIWPIILDGTTYAANESKVVASFQPNDVDQFLYVWDQTYSGVEASGKNYFGNNDGYTAMTVTGAGWSGAGFCLTADGNGWEKAEALRAAIVAEPDKYFLHLAMKSTDNYSHCFYIFGAESTKFVLGKTSVYDGAVYADFERDGAWHAFDIPMSKFASALANQAVEAGVNVFVVLTEGTQGAQLNIDAVYFYKK